MKHWKIISQQRRTAEDLLCTILYAISVGLLLCAGVIPGTRSTLVKIAVNQGAATKGTDNDTADKFGKKYIDKIISELSSGTYEPKPVRRTHIPKKNGSTSTRPFGIPSFKDKIVQDIIRMYLEAIYEPVFSDRSHGFRPNRSCHTALQQISKGFNGIILILFN